MIYPAPVINADLGALPPRTATRPPTFISRPLLTDQPPVILSYFPPTRFEDFGTVTPPPPPPPKDFITSPGTGTTKGFSIIDGKVYGGGFTDQPLVGTEQPPTTGTPTPFDSLAGLYASMFGAGAGSGGGGGTGQQAVAVPVDSGSGTSWGLMLVVALIAGIAIWWFTRHYGTEGAPNVHT